MKLEDMENPQDFIIPWKVRLSPQAKMIFGEMKEGSISLRELAQWVVNESSYGEIGGGQIIAFLQEKKNIQ